jgi:mono/diheme cytochrome c family protein
MRRSIPGGLAPPALDVARWWGFSTFAPSRGGVDAFGRPGYDRKGNRQTLPDAEIEFNASAHREAAMTRPPLTPPRRQALAVAAILLMILAAGADKDAGQPPAVRFDRDILPVLSDHCFQCHGPDAKARKGDLRLDLKEDALRTENPVIVPGKSVESELIARIESADPDEVMPPPKSNHALTKAQIATLRHWIDAGATWGKHWAFVPPTLPEVPAVGDPSWARNPIDRFILARLDAEGLKPSPEAAKTTLIRRVTLDLIGLPPTLDEIDAFLADDRPDAYERVVDRLLASPHYGERHAWDWLDAARYADSNGYQGDNDRTMWPWRDWVVDALNHDLPFDEFTTRQIAGDFLPDPAAKLATGFCRNHMINGEGGRISEENRVDYVMDMAETTGTVWLGLTFNCTRCHDHKFDPLTQRDYYGLFAFFNQTAVDGGGGNPQTPPVLEVATSAQTLALRGLRARLSDAARRVEIEESARFPRPIANAKDLPEEVRKALERTAASRSREQVEALEKHFAKGDSTYAAMLKSLRDVIDTRNSATGSIPRVMVMEDRPQPRETFILARGSYEKPTVKVEMSVPAALSTLPTAEPKNRLGLARWLVGSDNPLTARVTVNRAWQQLFGAGLVKTPEDFGVQGERPSHPDLLDWLAVTFRESGWGVKSLHRLIVKSSTYRQASRVTPASVERDPQNRLLARGPRFRLPSWQIRDQALAASGLLVRAIGGAPVKPYQPGGVWEEATFGNKRYQSDHGAALYRRSLYTFWRRIVGPTEFFDTAARQVCVVKPTRTNTPTQALITLNDVTFVEASRALAQRVILAEGTPEKRLDMIYRLLLSRPPTADERAVLLPSLARVNREFAADPKAAAAFLSAGESPRDTTIDLIEHASYAALCSTVINVDEVLCKE